MSVELYVCRNSHIRDLKGYLEKPARVLCLLAGSSDSTESFRTPGSVHIPGSGFRRACKREFAPFWTSCLTAVYYVFERAMIEREKALSSQNQQVEKKKDIVLPEFSRIGDMPSNLNKTPGWKLIKVSSDQLEYGDIIFLKGKTKTDRFVTHIAIAMSVDQIFHSSRDTKGGCIESLKSLFSKYQIHSRTTPLMENVDSRSNFMSASFVSTFLSPDYMPKPVPLRSPSPLNISGFQAFCNSSPQVKDLFALSQKRAFFSVTNSSSSSSVFDSPPSEASSGSASSPSEGSSGSASPPSEGSSGSVSPPSEGSSGSASPPSEGSSVTSSSPSFLDRSSWSETKTNSPTELSPSGSAYQSKENSPTRILPTFSGHLPSFPALLA